MKAFYSVDEIQQTKALDVHNIVKVTGTELDCFFSSFSKEDNVKLCFMKKHDLVKIYTIMLHKKNLTSQHSARDTPIARWDDDLFNLNVFGYDSDLIVKDRIKVEKDFNKFSINKNLCLDHLKKTLSFLRINKFIDTAWILFYKDGAHVPCHVHPDTRLILHFL